MFDHLVVIFLALVSRAAFLKMIDDIVLAGDELLGLGVLKAEDGAVERSGEDVAASDWAGGRVVGVHEVCFSRKSNSSGAVAAVVARIV